MNEGPLILFDGICNFCNSAVNFVIARDKKSSIRFATLQSGAGAEILKKYGLPADHLKSFVFIEKGVPFTRSTAALKVCRNLKGAWPLCYGLIIVPRFIRDSIYDFIARNRYKWFGVKQECMVPGNDLKSRFLD